MGKKSKKKELIEHQFSNLTTSNRISWSDVSTLQYDDDHSFKAYNYDKTKKYNAKHVDYGRIFQQMYAKRYELHDDGYAKKNDQ